MRRPHHFSAVLAASLMLLTGSAQAEVGRSIASRASAQIELKNAEFENIVDQLESVGLSTASAKALAKRIVAGDAEALKTGKLIMTSAARMQEASVPHERAVRVLEEIARRGLTDPTDGGAADGLSGVAILEAIVGAELASKLPGYATQRAGDVYRAVLKAQGELQLVGKADSALGDKLVSDIVKQAATGSAAERMIHAVVDPIWAKAKAKAEQEAAIKDGSVNAAGPRVSATPVSTPPTVKAPDIKGGVQGSIGQGSVAQTPIGGGVRAQPATSASGGGLNNSRTLGSSAVVGTGVGASVPGAVNRADLGASRISGGNGSGSLAGGPTHNGEVGNARGSGSGSHPDAGAGRNGGGGSGGGSGRGSGSGDGTGGGSGGGTGTGDSSGAGNGGGGSGSGRSGGKKDEGTGGGDGGGGNGDTASHDDPDVTVDILDDEMTVENLPAGTVVDIEGTPLAPGMERSRGTGTGLSEATGGRLGGGEAANARRGVDLKTGGGGAAGPRTGDTASGVLMTPEEHANARRALGMAAGGGVTDPARDDIQGHVVTDRDLKNLGLKGNGGAKGPTDSSGRTAPTQAPQSPLAGAGPIVPPSGLNNAATVSNIGSAPALKAEVKAGLGQ